MMRDKSCKNSVRNDSHVDLEFMSYVAVIVHIDDESIFIDFQ